MTAPPKTPSPKEALEGILTIVNESKGIDGFHLNGDIATWDEFEEEVEAVQAAIPVAELHGQAVELLNEVDVPCTCPTVAPLAPHCKHKRKEEIFKQLEALKCTPPK